MHGSDIMLLSSTSLADGNITQIYISGTNWTDPILSAGLHGLNKPPINSVVFLIQH